MHSATAHADAQTSLWSNYFGCAKKDKVWQVTTTSFGGLVGSHKLTDKSAQSFIEALAGARVASQTTPYVLSAVRSPRSRALLGISMFSSGALAAYQWFACE
jgi:hypothetical protein